MPMRPKIDTSVHPTDCSCLDCRLNGTGESAALFECGLQRALAVTSEVLPAIEARCRRMGQAATPTSTGATSSTWSMEDVQFGVQLREWRESRGLHRQQVAQRAHLLLRDVQDAEEGRCPSRAVRQVLCETLDDWLQP